MNKSTKIAFILVFFNCFLIALSIEKSIASEIIILDKDDISMTDTYNINTTQLIQKRISQSDQTALNISINEENVQITNLTIDFANISFDRDVYSIQESYDTYIGFGGYSTNPPSLFESCGGYAQELNISEPLVIFGVDLYICYDSLKPPYPSYVKILNVTDLSNINTNEILGEIPLNTTNTPNWYSQYFPSPIYLEKGTYYLFVNASRITSPNPDRKIRWYANSSANDDLSLLRGDYIDHLDIYEFTNIGTTNSFLHRLIYRKSIDYFPSEINMTTSVNNETYAVSNSGEIGEGHLYIHNLSLSNITTLSLSFNYNVSQSIAFNVTYTLFMTKLSFYNASLLLKNDSPILWTLTPNLNTSEIFYNHTFLLPISQKWYDYEILKNDTDLISEAEFSNGFLLLKNISLGNDIWVIRFKSDLNSNLAVSLSDKKIRVDTELSFSVTLPAIKGSLKIFAINPLDVLSKSESLSVSKSEQDFVFAFTESDYLGDWNLYVYWLSENNYGVCVVSFTLLQKQALPSEEDFFFIILLTIIACIVVGISSYTTLRFVKNSKTKKEKRIEEFKEEFKDILSMKYIMMTHKESGLDFFNQNFYQQSFDSSLVSGFLQAITMFGLDLTSSDMDEMNSVSLEYKNLKINMNAYHKFRIIIFMTRRPSNAFLLTINSLCEDIQNIYGKELENFDGNISKFRFIENLLIKHLNIEILEEFILTKHKDISMTNAEKSIWFYINSYLKKNSQSSFYLRNIFEDKEQKEDTQIGIEEIKAIPKLIEKKLIKKLKYIEK